MQRSYSSSWLESERAQGTVSPDPADVTVGSPITLTAMFVDKAGGLKFTVTGTVTWGDRSAKGTFSSLVCALSDVNATASSCSVIYTPSAVGTVSIHAVCSGDDAHKHSHGTSILYVQSG